VNFTWNPIDYLTGDFLVDPGLKNDIGVTNEYGQHIPFYVKDQQLADHNARGVVNDPNEVFQRDPYTGRVNLVDVPNPDAADHGFPQTQTQTNNDSQSAQNALFQYLMSLQNGGGGGGSSAAAQQAAIQAAVDKINEDHARQIAAIGLNRDQGLQGIANALSTFQQGTGANNAQYNTASDSINRAIADRLAQAMAQQQSASTAQANQASQLGWNGAAIQANAENNNNALQNALRYQQDLSDRYRQVQSNSQGATANAGQLMNQGAQGQLANNYNSALNSADAAASDATYRAQHPTSSGGGGGGSSTNSLKDMSTAWDLASKMSSNNDPMTALMTQVFKADPTGFLANDSWKQYVPGIAQAIANPNK
jgi:hypothetical protein